MTLHPKPTPTPVTESSAAEFCTLPPTSTDKTFTVQCPDNGPCNRQPGQKVPKYTVASFKCNPGYHHGDAQSLDSICSDGKVWSPQIAKCNKICKKLKPKNVELVCYRRGVDVDCEGTLVAGTTVRPSCKFQHREEYPVQYRNIICQADGEWTNPLFPCAPDCGKPFANATKLIAYGKRTQYGDSPWHVAIYDVSEKDKPLICGGTIVSPQLVISAAHCFFDDSSHSPEKVDKYEIVVSKVSRHYATKDNGLTKYYKIREIFYSPRGYTGLSTNFANDIVIIWLTEKISLSQVVLPACLRWTSNHFNPGENMPGKLVGWGDDENDIPSEILLSANLPYISYAKCIEIANPDFKGSITLDKFCAGSKKGRAGARKGDSGGGLLFRDGITNLYYLQGIVSIKDPTDPSVAVFTDVAHYIEWIDEIKNKVENEVLNSETSLKPKT